MSSAAVRLHRAVLIQLRGPLIPSKVMRRGGSAGLRTDKFRPSTSVAWLSGESASAASFIPDSSSQRVGVETEPRAAS
jgi:hypothetical protein